MLNPFFILIIHVWNESRSVMSNLCDLTPWTIYMVHGILQDRMLEWEAFLFSKGSSQPGIKPMSPALQVDSLPAEPPRKPYPCIIILIYEAWLSVQVTFTALYYSLYRAIIQGKPNVSKAASLTSLRDDIYHDVNIFIFIMNWVC